MWGQRGWLSRCLNHTHTDCRHTSRLLNREGESHTITVGCGQLPWQLVTANSDALSDMTDSRCVLFFHLIENQECHQCSIVLTFPPLSSVSLSSRLQLQTHFLFIPTSPHSHNLFSSFLLHLSSLPPLSFSDLSLSLLPVFLSSSDFKLMNTSTVPFGLA